MDIESFFTGKNDFAPIAIRNLKHVSTVKLDSNEINRAGIIPYCIINGKLFFAFGLTSFRKTLNVIGGAYDSQDFNLIDTAIREFEEETGDFFPKILRSDLLDSYAIETKHSIAFFVNMSYKVGMLKGDGELILILWITLKQLEILYRRQIKSEKILLGKELKKIAPKLIHNYIYSTPPDYSYNNDVEKDSRIIDSISLPDLEKYISNFEYDIYFSCNRDYITIGFSNFRFIFSVALLSEISKLLYPKSHVLYYVTNKLLKIRAKEFLPKNLEIRAKYFEELNLYTDLDSHERSIYEVDTAIKYSKIDYHYKARINVQNSETDSRIRFANELVIMNDKIINGYDVEEPDTLISLGLIVKKSKYTFAIP